MTVQYAVTFEFETRPPETYRGTLTAGRASTCARRAVEEAHRHIQPVNWRSMNFVILERHGAGLPEVDEAIGEPS